MKKDKLIDSQNLHMPNVLDQSRQLKDFLLFIQEEYPNYQTKRLKPNHVVKEYLENL